MSLNVFSIESFIAWAKEQDPTAEYEYVIAATCVMTKYFKSRGVKGTGALRYGPISIGENGPWRRIAQGYPLTYGAALERAEAELEEQR